jgi:hypothetical protein
MKLHFFIIATLLTITVTAQVKLGVKGGATFSTAQASFSAVKQGSSFKPGFALGAMADIPFEGTLHFSPSVMIQNRSFTITPKSGPTKKEQFSITYLDFIPSLALSFPSGDDGDISVSFGPNIGFTNFGRTKITDNNNVTTSTKIKFGYGSYGWFDLGLRAGLGVRIKKMLIEAAYMHGLTNINNNEEIDGRNIMNRMFSLNIGWFFKQTKN